MIAQIKELTKKTRLRNNEYYNLQETYDKLYEESKNKKTFNKLMPIIMSEQNILLAYRNIKKNKGSKTPGVDPKNILDMGEIESHKLVQRIRKRLENYTPQKVRRKLIPKANGKLRPLGIPTIEDRIVQQCVKQVLEPICEAKFHKHSYGFRPNRSAHHAVKRVDFLMMNSKLHYVVDIDIKGFFDNVNHAKLIKQMWAIGIRDKNLLCIIGKMLKAEIEGEGIPTKGTPQGGILSPLLSNIVLNELDWWISNQWETMANIKHKQSKNLASAKNKYAIMKKTALKEMFIVRYADDFKILCRDAKMAQRAFVAVKKWLKDRLDLDISPEKSKITNLRKNYTEFLGFKMKVQIKRKKPLVKTHMSNKAIETCIDKLKEKVLRVKGKPIITEVMQYNSTLMGMHNYYSIATRVNIDFHWIAYIVNRYIKKQLKDIATRRGTKSLTYLNRYGEYNFKTYFVQKVALFPVLGVKFRIPYAFKQTICNYTEEGRALIHRKLEAVNMDTLRYLMENPIKGMSAEYNDNRVSLYSGQKGKCAVTKRVLEVGGMEVHHKIPRALGGTDEYQNLIFLNKDVHKLIHSISPETTLKYILRCKLDKSMLNKVNKLRHGIGLNPIIMVRQVAIRTE